MQWLTAIKLVVLLTVTVLQAGGWLATEDGVRLELIGPRAVHGKVVNCWKVAEAPKDHPVYKKEGVFCEDGGGGVAPWTAGP